MYNEQQCAHWSLCCARVNVRNYAQHTNTHRLAEIIRMISNIDAYMLDVKSISTKRNRRGALRRDAPCALHASFHSDGLGFILDSYCVHSVTCVRTYAHNIRTHKNENARMCFLYFSTSLRIIFLYTYSYRCVNTWSMCAWWAFTIYLRFIHEEYTCAACAFGRFGLFSNSLFFHHAQLPVS